MIARREKCRDIFLRARQARAKLRRLHRARCLRRENRSTLRCARAIRPGRRESCGWLSRVAFELLGRGAQSEIGLRADQIDHRLGLRQIHLAVQESALGKFAGARGARSRAQASLQDARRHENTTVATDLDQIFAGVTVRRAMHREHHLVDDAVFLDDFAEVLDVRLELGRLLLPAKNADPRSPIASGPGDANQRDRAFARRTGDRGDGFASRRVQMIVRGQFLLSTSFNAAMHVRFCSIVPTEMRTHSGRL